MLRYREDEGRRQQELDQPEGDGEVGLRQREAQAAQEAGEGPGTAAPHQITVMKSIMFWTQKTARAVQRVAARGSSCVRRPLFVRSVSSRIFSSGSTTASSSRGPDSTRKRFQRASPSQRERYCAAALEAQDDVDRHRDVAARGPR